MFAYLHMYVCLYGQLEKIALTYYFIYLPILVS